MVNDEKIPLGTRYQGAWAEAQMRVNTRDQILFQYLIVSSVISGIALSNKSLLPVALVVPYLGFIATLMLAHHDLIISSLNRHVQRLVQESGLGDKDWFTSPRGLGIALFSGASFHTSAVLFAIGGLGIVVISFTKDAVVGDIRLHTVWYDSIMVEFFSILLVIITRVLRIYIERPRTLS